jgi:hypothetical protein
MKPPHELEIIEDGEIFDRSVELGWNELWDTARCGPRDKQVGCCNKAGVWIFQQQGLSLSLSLSLSCSVGVNPSSVDLTNFQHVCKGLSQKRKIFQLLFNARMVAHRVARLQPGPQRIWSSIPDRSRTFSVFHCAQTTGSGNQILPMLNWPGGNTTN